MTVSTLLQHATLGKSDHSGTSAPLALTSALPSGTTVSTCTLIGHRGEAAVAPEETEDGYVQGIAHGAHALKADFYTLADGARAAIHDNTTNRTMSASYSVSGLTAQQFKSLSVLGSKIGPSVPDAKPLLSPDVFNKLGGRTVLCIDQKDNVASGIIAEIVARGLQKSVVIWTSDTNFTTGMLPAAKAAGIAALFSWNSPISVSNPAPIDVIAAGATMFAIGYTYSDASITTITTAAAAAGLPCFGFSIRHRYQANRMLSLGCTGLLCNDLAYIKRTTAMLTTASWASKVPLPGTTPSYLPDDPYIVPILSSGRLSFDTTASAISAVIGSLAPITATTYTLTGSVTFDALDGDTTRHAAILVCAPDDLPFAFDARQNGYSCVIRENGTVEIFKQTRGAITNGVVAAGTSSSLGSTASTAISAAQTVPFTVAVTPTTVTFTRTDTGASKAVTDSTYRGGYPFLGKNGAGLSASFSQLAVS